MERDICKDNLICCDDNCQRCANLIYNIYMEQREKLQKAEEIKVKRDKPKPAKQFERGKHYRFSAKLFWENVENKYLFESIVIKNWVNKCDGEDIDKLEHKNTAIKPEWCYEVPAEKPQLPKKTLIIYNSTWPDEVEIYFEHLNDRVNALIDYLKARENND